MAAATLQAQMGTGASVSWNNVEGGMVWTRDDVMLGTTVVLYPVATGTNYSWIKNFVLSVLVGGSTNIQNRRVSTAASPVAGLAFHWKAVAVASYAQAAVGNLPAGSGSNGAVPAGYTAMTTTPAQYDGSVIASSATGPNGSMAVCVAGVDNTYAAGTGLNNPSPALSFTYDEL